MSCGLSLCVTFCASIVTDHGVGAAPPLSSSTGSSIGIIARHRQVLDYRVVLNG